MSNQSASAADLSTDWYRLSDDLTDRERDLVATVRRFVDDEVTPIINEAWERARFPEQLIPKMAELGIVGTFIEDYGCPGMTRREAGLVSLEMSRGDGSVNTFLGVHSGLAMGSIDLLGSEEQKQRWLPDMAALRKLGAFALTEPEHGSDSVGLETSAELHGDTYVLHGAKRWIGNAHRADVIVVWARDSADDKVKAFIVEREASGAFPAGFAPEIIEGKIGKRAIEQSHITIDNVRVPAANLLEKSQSFRDASAVLAKTRSGACWEAVGHAMAAYEIALDYAKTRVQFGSPIAEYQLVQHRLAKMLAEITAMQLYCFRIAELGDTDRLDGTMSSMAKMYTAERARWVCGEARDLLGGNGMLLEHHIARHMTDMEVVYTYEGTDSIQSLIVGRAITGTAAFGHPRS